MKVLKGEATLDDGIGGLMFQVREVRRGHLKVFPSDVGLRDEAFRTRFIPINSNLAGAVFLSL
jgi:hypothetical protein